MCANILSAAPLIARWLHMDDDDAAAQDYREFRKAYIKRQNSGGNTAEYMSRILATPSPGPTLMSLTGLTTATAGDDTSRWTNTPTPRFSSYESSSIAMEREEKREKQQQQQATEEAGEENDSIHELLHQSALMGSLRSATPSSRCGTASSMSAPGSRCQTPTTPATPATPSTPGGPMHLSQNHLRHQVSRISSRSSVRSSFGDIQVRRVVVLRVEGVEPGHRGQSFGTHVTSCDDVSSCHSSERGMNMEASSS